MSEYTINDSTSFSNRSNTPNAWNSDTVSDDRPQLLTWLSPLDPGLRHRHIQENRVSDVGEWLMGTEEFTKWYGLGRGGHGESTVLFCYGDLGVGKTFISSLVVDRLCDQASGKNAAVSCFYLDFAARNEQSATNVLGSLLKQIVSGMERIPEEISRIFRQQKTTIGGRRPQLVDIVRMLQLVTSYQPTFMCLDALDECSRVQRAKLLDSLQQILEKSPGTRIFTTGRPHIQAEIEKRLPGQVTIVSVSPNRGDIARFLRVKLGEDDMLDAMDDGLEADILQKIPENMSQMFRLVSLSIEAILRESTIYGRQERLSKMADGLEWGSSYGPTIERIMALDGDRSRLGMEALMWVSHAERPLRVDELCHALAVKLGSKDFNAGNAPSISTLEACCQGLITVDGETSTVRLVHFTLGEYLLARSDLFNKPHSAMAEICLTFLNSEHLNALAAKPYFVSREEPFLDYSSRYWGVHAKRETSDSIKSLALKMFREYDNHISARCLLAQVDAPDHWSSYAISGTRFGGLHCASFFGIVEFVLALIEMECCYINGKDIWGCTPLAWAARNGHEEAVRILLRQENIDPKVVDNGGRTLLAYAAQGGSEELVKILLARAEFKPDELDHKLRTPLSYAAQYGHEGVLKILLARREVNPDQSCFQDRTPLSHAAAQCGSEGVVKILLEREDVNPNHPCDCGRTPLFYAAMCGSTRVVKMLLARQEVNPDRRDNYGRTPLSYAVENRHRDASEIVKILLEQEGVNPDKQDKRGRTPLLYAASCGHEEVVTALLELKEVNPDMPDNDGRTPLSYVAGDGYLHTSERVVKILLERGEVNPAKPDNYGRTPLSYAARSGSEEVVTALLGLEGANPDLPDNDGRTPLSYLMRNEYVGVVEILLERDGVNPDKPDREGRTPLSYAAEGAPERSVKALLAQEAVNPDKPDNRGRTPLSYAAVNAREGVVRILLGREEVSPDKLDREGRTPLSYAAASGRERSVEALLAREDVNPDKPDNHGRTPLSYAMLGSDEGVVVKTLLGHQEVDPDKPDREGRTPLSYASAGGRERSVEALLAREDVNPDMPDNHGRTPLSYAAKNGHEGAVKILLGRKEVNPNRLDDGGQTPLMFAASDGRLRVVELLRPYEAVARRAV